MGITGRDIIVCIALIKKFITARNIEKSKTMIGRILNTIFFFSFFFSFLVIKTNIAAGIY